jgi:hypothetical protein
MFDPNGRILRSALASLAFGLIALLAFAQLFTTFVPWDDEGYFLQAYRDVLSGRILFDQVFSIYGPLTFFISALFSGFHAANVTHDALRWVTMPVWIAIASLMAAVVWRLTRRFSSSLIAFLLVGLSLRGLAKAVGHPQLWIILAAAALLWRGLDWLSQPGKESHAFLTGILVGSIVLLKINLGTLVSIALLLAVALHLTGKFRKIACGSLAIFAAALGVALLLAHTTRSEKCFVLAYLASLAATLALAIRRSAERQVPRVSLMWLTLGFAACVCIGLGATLASGTSFHGLYTAFISGPQLLAGKYHNPFRDATRRGSILICAASLAAGVLCWRAVVKGRAAWLGLAKTAAGSGLLFAFCYDPRLALTGSLLFLWLLIVDVHPLSGEAYSDRLLLALLAPLFSLQLYPMAGEQVDWSTLLPIVAATILLADGLSLLERENYRVPLPRLTRFAATAIVTALTLYLFGSAGKNALGRLKLWRDSPSLNLPGAHLLRLPARETARLQLIVRDLAQNCHAVLIVPGLYSFALWSGVEETEEKKINSWPFLWPDEVEKHELPDLRHQSGGCVLVIPSVYSFFRYLAVSPGNHDLPSEIQRTMIPVTVGPNFTLYRYPPQN